jgi:DNA-binding transcriptional LysR family regulator
VNLRSVDLNLLTVFDAVITEGSVTRAAEKIGTLSAHGQG